MSADVVLLASLAAGTLVAEDAAALAAGLLVSEGRLGLVAVTATVAAGIWLGDLLLYAAGRAGGPALESTWVRRWLSPADLARARARFDRHAPVALLATRVLPGTRTATYVAAGALGLDAPRFAAWSALAVVLWTPLLVGGASLIGSSVAQTSTAPAVGIVFILMIAWVGARLAGRRRRRRVPVPPVFLDRLPRLSPFARVRQWEFWPAWIFYAPVLPWIGALLLRYGGRAIAAANPGLEDGGFVGESKTAILRALPEAWVVPFAPVAAASVGEDAGDRADLLERLMARRGWSYQVVLKPDSGQRGAGVRLVRDRAAAAAYLAEQTGDVVAQVYHPGPYEAGIFYVRRPGEARGRIFSITDKRFPIVTGDGESALADLIRRHPRFRFQARVFLARHRARLDWIPPAGRSVALALAGNHAQGTMFVDGASLETPALTARIDEIARAVPGFHIGRFDVRYADPRGLMAGTDLAIVELNGVTAEATHIYDPSRSLWSAYLTLFRQWLLVFQIGSANLRAGCRASSFARLLRLSVEHLTARGPALPAD